MSAKVLRVKSGATVFAVLALILAVCIAALAGPGAGRASSQEACDPGYDTGHILVRMEPDASAEALDAMKALNGEGGEYESRGLERLWIVTLPAGLTVPEAVALYGASEGVAYAEPDHKVYLPEDDPAQACQETGAAVRLTLSDQPDPVFVGGTLLYESTVRNGGPETARDVELTTGVEAGSTFISAGFVNGDAKGSCEPGTDRLIRCSLGEVAAGKSATFTLKVRPTEAGILSGLVSVHSSNSGYAPEVLASARTGVLPAPETWLGTCTISGTAGRDVIKGTSGRDVICGFGGDDVLSGEGGNDVILGFVGNDTLAGGEGADKLVGNAGLDTLRARDGVKGNDFARGGDGDDAVFADPGDDMMD
ncbi:S8 family serine peptidase [Rubrobacter tropicus]|uniref:S8 family serine peptidase n=1 Tax=Rubrobacter tropicus TaxID=2653851 RepID=UPI00140E3110|nr:DUF11 domain-containing protein [Rubrobacter tropicus]